MKRRAHDAAFPRALETSNPSDAARPFASFTFAVVFSSGVLAAPALFGCVASTTDDPTSSAGGTGSGQSGGSSATGSGAGSSATGSGAGSGAGGSTTGSGGSGAAGGTGTGAGGTGTGSGGSGTTGGSSGTGIPEPPGIQYFGRWDHGDATGPSASWGPVGIKARFEGTSVAVNITDSQNTFEYSIDGAEMQMLGPGLSGEVQLATGLADDVHTLELFRRSEGGYGKTVISGLVLDAGKEILEPPLRPARSIEVVGDSISAGFGNEGMGGSTPETQNGYMAYGPQLARLLDAEWSVIAHSGQGMYRNLCEAIPPSGQHMLDEFKMMQHPGAGGGTWDFSTWQPDVLVVTLGTNDYADYPPGSCAAPDGAAFVEAYKGFLTFARSVYPDAHVFAVGTFIATNDNQFKTCNENICAAVDAMGDANMHCVDPSLGPSGYWLVGPGDYIGDWTHPTIAGHTKVAEKLRDVIKPVLGW